VKSIIWERRIFQISYVAACGLDVSQFGTL